MKIKNRAPLDRFKKYILSLTPQDKVAVIHHTDPDGVCSGVIMAKIIERIRGKKIDLRHNQKGNIHTITPATYTLLKSRKINKVIITDLGCDESPEYLKKLASFADVLYVDHHKIYTNLSNKMVFIKPQMFCDVDPAKYSAAKLSYDLGLLVADISDLDWLAAVGSIGDIATRPWESWLRGVFKKYKLGKKKDLFRTKLGETAILISSAESYDIKNVKMCFDVLYTACSYKDVLRSGLNKFRKKIDDELNYYLKNMKKNAFFERDFIYYEISPKYHTKSPLSTILGLKYPHKSVIVAGLNQSPIGISGRRGDGKVKINKLLRDSCKGIPGAYAGGHSISAGATVPRNHFNKFKRIMLEKLRR